MSTYTYLEALGIVAPTCAVHTFGDGSTYAELIYDGGAPMPTQATLDAYIAANPKIIFVVPGLQQLVTGTFGTLTTNAVIPYDNTVPLITEGTEAFNVVFTPKFSGSKVLIRLQLFVAHTAITQRYISGALFNGSTCIRSTVLSNVAAVSGVLASIVGNQSGNATIEVVDTPNTTSAVTYSFRVGSDNSSGTLSVNQGASGETYGTPGRGVYTIYEIL